jgi:Uma2 family endonuclease
MVRALPDDGNRYETVYGELLVTPSPRPLHQLALMRLIAALSSYLERWPVAQLLASPADISWGPDTLVQPDLFVVPLDEMRTMDWERIKTLLLVVEVLSPSTARHDRFTKRRLYQDVRIPAYWIVDADARAVDVWTPETTFPTLERDRLIWHATGAAEPFILALADLFRPV